MLDGKPLESIDESELQKLIINEVSEGKKYDYKNNKVGDSPGEKKEFLSDVSSFSNCVGGHLILGIEEVNGVPIRMQGLNIVNEDAEKNRLDQIIQTGIQPRMIPTHQIHIVKLQNLHKIVILRIYNSLTKPHMVTFQNSNKFYSRNSHGKYLMDVGEIRNLFLMSESAIEKVKNFRMDRLGRIHSGEANISASLPKMVMHIIPLSISDSAKQIDVSTFDKFDLLMPMRANQYKKRYNFDGLLLYQTVNTASEPDTYTQLFRNGCIESAEAITVGEKDGIGKGIPGIKFEEVLIRALQRFLLALEHIAVDPPFFIMVSLLDVSGYRMITKDEEGIIGLLGEKIDRDNLLLSEVILDSFDIESSKVLKPIFDSIWNSCGWKASQDYDNNGNWNSK